MIKMKTTFSRREQFWFGPLFALFGSMIGGIALWKFSAPEVAKWIWIFSAVIIALYYIIPPLRKWIFMGWLGAVFPIGWAISHLLLSVVFYLVVSRTEMGLRKTCHGPTGVFTSDNHGSPTLPDVPRRFAGRNTSHLSSFHKVSEAK